MSLLAQAAADLRAILEDDVGGFAVAIVLTNPYGVSATLKGLQTDHALTIDPDTGQAVTGANASVALSIPAILAVGPTFGMPRGISDSAMRPWIVQFTTPTGDTQKFKVSEALPDKLGCLVCRLEAWRE